MASDLLVRLNAHIGEEAVRSLRFTVSRKVKESVLTAAAEGDVEEFYAFEDDTPSALTEIELAQATSIASAIKEDGLRQAALKAMVRDLEQKKGRRSNPGGTGA